MPEVRHHEKKVRKKGSTSTDSKDVDKQSTTDVTQQQVNSAILNTLDEMGICIRLKEETLRERSSLKV